LPGGEDAQFWWVVAAMILMIAAMLTAFRRKHWI
jgi:LPXTG-motif cell wall-anchored protein